MKRLKQSTTAFAAALIGLGASPAKAQDAADDACRMSLGCVAEGTCVAMGDRCIAANDADCASATACYEKGACAAVAEVCRPSSQEHCRAARICVDKGACFFDAGEGHCDDGTERRSLVTMKIGIAALALAGASAFAGYMMLATVVPNDHLDSTIGHAGVGTLASGGVLLLTGVVLVIYGASWKQRPDATVVIAPSQAEFVFRF